MEGNQKRIENKEKCAQCIKTFPNITKKVEVFALFHLCDKLIHIVIGRQWEGLSGKQIQWVNRSQINCDAKQ